MGENIRRYPETAHGRHGQISCSFSREGQNVHQRVFPGREIRQAFAARAVRRMGSKRARTLFRRAVHAILRKSGQAFRSVRPCAACPSPDSGNRSCCPVRRICHDREPSGFGRQPVCRAPYGLETRANIFSPRRARNPPGKRAGFPVGAAVRRICRGFPEHPPSRRAPSVVPAGPRPAGGEGLAGRDAFLRHAA